MKNKKFTKGKAVSLKSDIMIWFASWILLYGLTSFCDLVCSLLMRHWIWDSECGDFMFFMIKVIVVGVWFVYFIKYVDFCD